MYSVRRKIRTNDSKLIPDAHFPSFPVNFPIDRLQNQEPERQDDSKRDDIPPVHIHPPDFDIMPDPQKHRNPYGQKRKGTKSNTPTFEFCLKRVPYQKFFLCPGLLDLLALKKKFVLPLRHGHWEPQAYTCQSCFCLGCKFSPNFFGPQNLDPARWDHGNSNFFLLIG
jgi:hypothetical protein